MEAILVLLGGLQFSQLFRIFTVHNNLADLTSISDKSIVHLVFLLSMIIKRCNGYCNLGSTDVSNNHNTALQFNRRPVLELVTISVTLQNTDAK